MSNEHNAPAAGRDQHDEAATQELNMADAQNTTQLDTKEIGAKKLAAAPHLDKPLSEQFGKQADPDPTIPMPKVRATPKTATANSTPSKSIRESAQQSAAPTASIPLYQSKDAKQSAGQPAGAAKQNDTPNQGGAGRQGSAVEPQRPTGASAGTIVFGVIMLFIGIITVIVGIMMTSTNFTMPALNTIIACSTAGAGVTLSLIAIIWGIVGHTRNTRRNEHNE